MAVNLLEEYRSTSGLQAIAAKCFEAANFSSVLIDGIILRLMLDV